MNLKVAIIRSGQTQRELSLVARIPESRLSAIVRGTVQPTDEERARIARSLQTTVDELFTA